MTHTASISRATRAAVSALSLVISGQALAAPGNSHTQAGDVRANVVEPIGIQNVADLRFGRIMQPSAAGTVAIDPLGVVTESGGAVGQTNTPQLAGNRGPGAFAVFGDPRRRFLIFLPLAAVISNGTNTMLVDQFEWEDQQGFGFGRMDSNGYAPVLTGARLNINANQATGTYSGTYNVTVLYL